MSRRFVLGVSLGLALACGGGSQQPVIIQVPVAQPGQPAVAPSAVAPAQTGSSSTKTAAATKPAESKPAAKKSTGGTAGEIQVTTGAAVQLYVDGIPAVFDPTQGYVMQVTPGTHHVEIVNLAGKTQVDEDITVSSGTRSMFRYKNGGIWESKGEAPVHYVDPEPEPAYVPPPVYVATGNVLFDGSNVYDARVWVDGYEIYRGEAGDYWAVGINEGPHEMRIEAQGKVVYNGPVDVRGSQTRRCTTSIDTYTGEAYGFDCHWVAG